MAEVIAAVTGGLSIASFGIQLSEKIFQIKSLLDAAKCAAPEIQSCLEEIELLNDILLDWEMQNPAPLGDRISKRCAEQCRRAVGQISELLSEFQDKIRKRKYFGSMEFAFRRSDLDRILGRLERVKSTLNVAHLVNQQRFQTQWVERQDKWMQALISRVASDDSTKSPLSSSSPPSTTLAKSQHIRAHRYTFRVALPVWLSGKVWEAYTARSQTEWVFRMRTYNIIPKDSQILRCAGRGDIDGLKYLLRQGQGSVLDCDEDGVTALCHAVMSGSVAAAEYLLNEGADPCSTPGGSCAPLIYSSIPFAAQGLSPRYRSYEAICNRHRQLEEMARLLVPKSGNIIHDRPHTYLSGVPGCVLQSALSALYPPIYERPLSERIRLITQRPESLLLNNRNADDIFLVLTEDERENISLYWEWVLRPIVVWCADTSPYFPGGFDGYHSVLTKIFLGYSSQIRPYTGELSLVRFFIGLWFYRICIPGHYITSWWKLDNRKVSGVSCVPIRILTRALHAAGVDLLQFGAEEASLFTKGLVEQDIECLVKYDNEYITLLIVRLIGFSYGPNPDDWYCWFSTFRDEYAGEFWNMVENGEPQLPVPGAWID
ncbi:hypothetical protein FQN54_006905 [Arachnomyces sp. PD_36]|nr:hypothetical protein FQN54_006905 [Arachnomyces sp. PD_36]